jgi:hypothetical protein
MPSGVGGHVGALGDDVDAVLDEVLRVLALISFWVALGKAQSALTVPQRVVVERGSTAV